MLYMSHDLRVMNMYYPAKQTIGHGTWTSIPCTSEGVSEPSMLDVIVCSASLHKCVKNCCVLPNWLESEHPGICINVVVTSIKFKATTSLNTGTIDWQKIMTNDAYKQFYNANALSMMTNEMDYDDFNAAILEAGRVTAMTVTERCKGWYMFSRNDLMPVIEEKNQIVHTLQHDKLPTAAAASL